MNKKFQNIFFTFGLVVLCIIVYNLDFADAWQKIQHAGYWFFAVVVLWCSYTSLILQLGLQLYVVRHKTLRNGKKYHSSGFIRLLYQALHLTTLLLED